MPRGGRRQGRPGVSYSQRTDLNVQPVRTTPSQHYGDRVANERAQQAQPLPQAPGIHPTVQAMMQAPVGQGAPAPSLLRDTERPGEPVQAGLDANLQSTDLDLLRALKDRFPSAGMNELFSAMGFG